MGAQRIGFCTHSGLSISTQFWGRGLTVGIRVRQELRGDLGPGVVDQPDQPDPHRLAYTGRLQLATHASDDEEIGRASRRERVDQYELLSVGAVSLKKKLSKPSITKRTNK